MAVPWTLSFPRQTSEEEATFRAEVARLQASPDVEFVAELSTGTETVLVRFHDELVRTTDPELLRIHETYRLRSENENEIRSGIVERALATAEGRSALAMVMGNMIRNRLGLGVIEEFEEGAPVHGQHSNVADIPAEREPAWERILDDSFLPDE